MCTAWIFVNSLLALTRHAIMSPVYWVASTPCPLAWIDWLCCVEQVTVGSTVRGVVGADNYGRSLPLRLYCVWNLDTASDCFGVD